MPNPAGLSYAKVIGRYQTFVGDGVDTDDLPDFIALEGTGTITANLVEAHDTNIGQTSVYLPAPIEVTVVDGWVTRGINAYVMVLRGSAGVTPIDFNYQIKLSLRPVGSSDPYVDYGPFNFDPTPDPQTGVVDLALATPVDSVEGVAVIIGPRGLQGIQGPPGNGTPSGGLAHQILRKDSANSTTEWAHPDTHAYSLNPSFDDWSGALPALYLAHGTGPTKETAITKRGPHSARFNCVDTTTERGLNWNGILANSANIEYWTVELTFQLVSGTGLGGAGVFIDWVGMTSNRAVLSLATEVPAPITGKWYAVSKVLRRPTGATGTWTGMDGFLMAQHSAGTLGTREVKDIIYDWLNVRPASAEEIIAYGAETMASSTVPGRMSSDDKTKLDAATQAATPSTLVMRDSAGLFSIGIQTQNYHPTRKDYVDTPATSSVAGRMSAADKAKLDAATSASTVSTIAMRNSSGDSFFRRALITDAPTAADHATRKDYVDLRSGTSMTAVLPTVAPSGYPVGYTYFTTGDASWPVQFGTVATLRQGTARTVQHYYPKTGGAWRRTEGDGDVWGAWSQTSTTGGTQPVGKDEIVLNTADHASVAAAVAAHPNKAVFTKGGVGGFLGNIYGAGYDKALGYHLQVGTAAVPSADAAPIIWTHKYSSADRPGVMTNEWSQGVYHQITKVSGGSYDAAITGYVRNQGGTGQSVGIHGRASGYTVDSDVFGMWAYASAADPAIVPKSIIGMEIDMNNKCPDQGWEVAVGASRGLLVVGADGSNPLTRGIEVGAGLSSPNGKFWTGILMRKDGIMPSGANSGTQINNGEAIRLDGATVSADNYNGIRFRNNFALGISFTEASFASNAAMVLADDHRIVVGPGPSSSTYLTMNKTTSVANLNNMVLHINGTQVVGLRQTGWGAATGTIDKTAWSTYTAPTISATYVQSEVQAMATHIQVLSRHLAALQQATTYHGQIGV